MATFKSLDEALDTIKKCIKIVLEEEVLETVIEEEQESIESVVYDAGTPKVYDRRLTDGGLQDPSNMWPEIYGGDNTFVLDVSNITPFNTEEGKRSEYLANGKEILMDKHYQIHRWIYLNSATGAGKDGPGLDMLVEYGNGGGGYKYDTWKGWWSKPRPFTQTTIENLSANKKHVTALKQGLIDRGIPVK